MNPSAENNDAIRWASKNGHTEVVKLLLADDRVDPSSRDNSAIKLASSNSHSEVVKLLLADGRIDIKEKILSVYGLLIMNKSYEKIPPTFNIKRIFGWPISARSYQY